MSPILTLFIQISFIIAIYAILAYMLYIYKSMKYLKTQKQKFEEIHKNINVGKRVLLSSGLIGYIVSMDQDVLKISLSKELEIEASIYSVQSIL